MLMSNYYYLYSINTLIIVIEQGAAQQKPRDNTSEETRQIISLFVILITMNEMNTIIQPNIAKKGIGTFNEFTTHG